MDFTFRPTQPQEADYEKEVDISFDDEDTTEYATNIYSTTYCMSSPGIKKSGLDWEFKIRNDKSFKEML